MKALKIIIPAVIIAVFLVSAAMADNSGRIYGKILTYDGDVLEGLIRWDKNEGSWVDMLDGSKEIPRKYRREADRDDRRKYRERRSKVSIFGIEIYDDDGSVYYSKSAQSGIRFGHIKKMTVIDDDRVLLELKSGEEVELSGGSTDIGTSIREIVIEDVREGELELSWDDIEEIEFLSAKSSEKSGFGERLYGTVSARRGETFTGYICWDVDELFEDDVLDGEESHRKRKVKFGKIAAIERYSSSGAAVKLKNGDELVLRGTNDVNSGNRGIIVSDPGFGQVTIDWDEFEQIEFKAAPDGIGYDKFDGGRPLRGTVYTEDGDKLTGLIRWDNDEEYTWEILDGEFRGMEFDIEFGLIKTIEKTSSRGSVITLLDGREFRLRGSNDVDSDNKGVYITLDDGDDAVVDWEDFEKVEFAK